MACSAARRSCEGRTRLRLGVAVVLVAAITPPALVRLWCGRHGVPLSFAAPLWGAAAVLVLGPVVWARRPRRSAPAAASPPPRVGAEVVLLAASTIVAAAVLEGLLRIYPMVGLPPSLGHALEWRERHQTAGRTPTGAMIDVFSPLLGWELRPNLRTRAVTSNAEGFRGAREYDRRPAPGVHRVLCVGDSFTFGENLRDRETMPARLAGLLDRGEPGGWEVLNIAVHGYGTDQQWLRLRRKGLRYHPEVVVLGFFEDDLERNLLWFRDYAKPYFDLRDGRLVLRGVPVPPPAVTLAHRPPRLPAFRLAALARRLPADLATEFDPLLPLEQTAAGRVTLAILDTMRRAVRRRAARLVVVSIPRAAGERATDTERMLARWARATSTPFVSLREAYLRLPPGARRTLYRGHWTPAGARASAAALAPVLRAGRG